MEGDDGRASESTVKTEGSAAPNEENKFTVEVNESGEVVTTVPDATAPIVSISSPEGGKTYENSETVPTVYSAEDETTAKENLTTRVTLDEAAYAKPDLDLSLLPLGAHTLTVTATDEAGNTGEATANFTAETSWDALPKNIDHYAALKLFKNKGEARMLKQQIIHLRQTAEFLEKYDVFFRSYPGLRDIFTRGIKRRFSVLKNYVKHRSDRSIDSSAAGRIIETMIFLAKKI